MSPVKLFHRYRGLTDFTLGSLLAAVRRLLPKLVGRQTRYKVTDMPSERTIRFYMAKGLVDKPLGKRGTTSLFSYRHLLQVLTVKYLQSQYLPLKKIEAVMRGRSNRELERFLPEGSAGASSRRILAVETEGTHAHPVREADKPLLSPDRRGTPFPDEALWRRYPIAEGVEVHLNEDLAAVPGPGDLEVWEKKVRLVLESLPLRRGRRGGRD